MKGGKKGKGKDSQVVPGVSENSQLQLLEGDRDDEDSSDES